MAMTTAMVVMVMPRGTLPSALELPVHFLNSLPLVLYDLLDVRDPVKVHLELVNLAQQVVKTRYLGVGVVHQIAGPVILLHGDDGALVGQPLDLRLDVLQEPVEMSAEGGQAASVEEESALRGCAAGRP